MNLTLFLVVITAAVSIYAFNNRVMFDKLKFNPYMVSKKNDYKRLFTHGLLHADWMHLIVNMYVLYAFGDAVESMMSLPAIFPKTFYYGKFLFVFMYLLALPISSLPALLKHKDNHAYNAVGASGAVSAVLFASIIMFPQMKLGFLFVPFIKIPGPIFGIAYLAYSYYMGKKGLDNIGHDAHFVGALFGLTFPIMLNPEIVTYFLHSIF